MFDTPTHSVALQVFGHAHPVVLHLPFGVFVSLVLLEFVNLWRGTQLAGHTRGLLVILAVSPA